MTFPAPRAPETAPPPRTVRHVIAIGGGRGGVGKSVVATNLAVYLAQLGRRVMLIDADPSGGKLHTLLGVELASQHQRQEEPPEELESVETPVPGLVLSPQQYTPGSTVPVRPGRKPRWAAKIRHLEVDYVLLDLGSGTAPATLDLTLGADMMLFVTSPEPPSIEATYRYMRALFQRSIRRTLVKDRFKMRLVERAQAELPPLPSPQELVRAIARYDTTVGQIAASELAKLRPRVLVNNVRLRSDGELGDVISEVAYRHLGAHLDYVGHIEQDDSVWLSIVRSRPLLIDSPTSKSARNLERIARRVLALATAREQARQLEPIALVPDEPTLYEVLGTHRGATDEELRRAYKRQRETYQNGSLPLTSLLTEEQLKLEQTRIEEAFDTLLDPVRRRAYDISTFPDTEAEEPERPKVVDRAKEAERAMLRQELSRELSAETEFTGALLQKVRESQGVEIEDIAGQTKIAASHLRAIEAEEFSTLPALVYTRGFVQQLARCLRLDAAQVSRTYLRRFREWQKMADQT